jgi:dihydroorotase
LGIKVGKLEKCSTADIVIFDPNEKWTVNPSEFKSKARNTPFGTMELVGKIKYTIAEKIVFYG